MSNISRKQLTCSLSLHLFCCNGEDREHLSNDLHENLQHFCGKRKLRIYPKALDETLDALKEFDKVIVARFHTLRRLYIVIIKRDLRTGSGNNFDKQTDIEKNTNSKEYYFCRGERLHNNVRIHFK